MLLSASVKQRRAKPKKHKDEPCRRIPTRRLAKPKSDFALQMPPPALLQQQLASIACVLLAISQLTALILQPTPLKSQEPVPVWVQVTPLLSLVVAVHVALFSFSGVEFVRFGLQIEA